MRWLLAAVLAAAGPAWAKATPVVQASSVHGPEFAAALAVDGDPVTRWASALNPGQVSFQIDLGRKVPIEEIRIQWEAAFAADYEVLVSSNGKTWKSIHTQSQGQGGKEILSGLRARGRYLKFDLRKPGPFPLYSIWEIELGGAKAMEALHGFREQKKPSARELKRAQAHLATEVAAAGAEEVVFATRELYEDGHWYANISYYAQDENEMTYTRGGGLYKLHVRSGKVTPLIEDAEGTLRDPAVHYDGKTLVFSWRKGNEKHFHLYTMQADGSDLRQLTFGDYDDIEPAWIPDGGIVFVSTRCRRWVNCWLTQVATVHRCNADGTGIVPISANLEQDNTPWPLEDGRILFMRWEYVDRSQVDYHHLWTMNPDGVGQTVFFGNMHPGGVFIDAKPIPGTSEVLLINSPGHGAKEHAGFVAIVSPAKGPDDLGSLKNIAEGQYCDPYPLTPDLFLAARGGALVAVTRKGEAGVLFQLGPAHGKRWLTEPRPLMARTPERLIPPRAHGAETTGKVILADAHLGRNMTGVKPGDIRRLLVLESLPKPINYTGGMDPLTYGGSFTLERVLGTVPVEEDGSAYFELPANRALFFVAQDAQGQTVKRMQSFMSVVPGETVSCVGCHEPRTRTAPNPGAPKLEALRRAPSAIEPIPGIPEVFDFPRDIQPILDRHCVSCHDYVPHEGVADGPRAGGVILSGDHGPMFSHSYVNLTVRGQISDGRDRPVSNLPPRSIGAVASPLIDKARGGHHGVQLDANEIDRLTYWIESGAAYPGTYGALGCGSIGGYYANTVSEPDFDWPESREAGKVIQARCLGCHVKELSLPQQLSDENGVSFWRPEWDDKRLLRSRHLVFNLSRPEQSLVLLAPLSKEKGGYGLCKQTDGTPAQVFTDQGDTGYRAILAMCEAGKRRLETIKRFDMPGFRPPAPYVREMVRYRVLSEFPAPEFAVDPYQCDRDYWRSFEADRLLKHEAYAEPAR